MQQVAIIIRWRTSAMPASAYATFHKACYEARGGTTLPVEEVREVPTSEVAQGTVCCECWEVIRGEPNV